MYRFSPIEFFESAHPLFTDREHVWEVLKEIGRYLATLKLGKIEGKVDARAYLINPESISIGKNSIVEPGAFIQGPCFIGEHVEVRSGAYIRGNVIVSDGCVVGHGTELKNTLFLEGAKAGHFSYVGDCILGSKVNLGAGVKCANLRLDGKEVKVEGSPTGLKKFGAIIGDHSSIGCNVVINPGTLIAKKTLVSPCKNIGGIYQ